MRRTSTPAILLSLVANTAICCASTRRSMCSAAAAARITGTSSASVLRAALPPDRRAHKLAPSQLEGILKSAGLCKVRRALATPFNLIIEAKRQSQV